MVHLEYVLHKRENLSFCPKFRSGMIAATKRCLFDVVEVCILCTLHLENQVSENILTMILRYVLDK